uniref:hypothetical protein n=1 Tax=Vibrio coralliilyticus TaxID=190893 RepID=UPI00159ECFED|nr:hypothetical protein [Vibrio coralliilyticus]
MLETTHASYSRGFDKTGTMIEGKRMDREMLVTHIITKQNLSFYAASGETRYKHPLGEVFVHKSKEENMTLAKTDQFEPIAGHGIVVDIRNNIRENVFKEARIEQ